MLSYCGPDDYATRQREGEIAMDDLLDAIMHCEVTLNALRSRDYDDADSVRRATAVVKIATELLEEV